MMSAVPSMWPTRRSSLSFERNGFGPALVAGEVHQRRAGVRIALQADARQVAVQVLRAARHVRERVLGAVAVAVVAAPAQVAEIVEQRGDHAEREAGRRQRAASHCGCARSRPSGAPSPASRRARAGCRGTRCRRAGSPDARRCTGGPGRRRRARSRCGGRPVVEAAVQAQHLRRHLLQVGGANPVGDVVVVATHAACRSIPLARYYRMQEVGPAVDDLCHEIEEGRRWETIR